MRRRVGMSLLGGTPFYDGIGGGRRALAWQVGNPGAVAALAFTQNELRAKSRDLVRRNAWAAAGVEAFVSNAIGTGIKPQSMLTDQLSREAIHSLWRDWCEEADAAGLTDFYGLQALACRAMLEGGECLVRLRYRRPEDGLPVGLQLQLLEPEHLPATLNQELASGNVIRAGIEFDKLGRRVAYHLYRSHPGDGSLAPMSGTGGVVGGLDTVRVPASEIIHLFRPLRPGQIRGEPWLARALVKLNELDQYDDAELVRKKTAAMFAGFITRLSPEDNLMGEGLRQRLNPEFINRNSLASRFGRWLGGWMEEQITYPFGTWLRRSPLHPVMVGVTVAGLAGILYGMGSLLAGSVSPTALAMPGGHLWVAERGDPYGSRSVASGGPVEPRLLWTLTNQAGFSGGPVVAADGTLYLPSLENKLLAYDANRRLLWEAVLPAAPVGSPALAADGMLVVAAGASGIYAFSANGIPLWSFQAQANGSIRTGPVISSAGMVYFLMDDMRGDTLIALSPRGELLWKVETGTRGASTAPRLSPDEDLVMVKNAAVNAADGRLIDLTLPSTGDAVLAGREQYLVGGDGLLYLSIGHTVMQWRLGSAGFEVVRAAEWNYRGAGFSQTSSFPVDAGVTRNGNIWLFYSVLYGGTSLYWLEPDGVSLGASPTPLFGNSVLVAVDANNTAVICGQTAYYGDLQLLCQAYVQGSPEPAWQLVLAENQERRVIGSALIPGRLYVTTSQGELFAVGDPPAENTAP
jgi:outer membrane protein assembly factor BamB